MNLTIGEIAKACQGKLVIQKAGNCDGAAGPAKQDTIVTSGTPVDSVVLDSRLVTAGGVFVATVGERVDGHRFIPQVFEAGAVLAITEKEPEQVESECGVAAGEWGSYVLVEDSFKALKDIAEFYRRKLSVPVVGITGSVGKTSTKEFIAGVLGRKYHVLKTEGNFNNEVGVPLTILRIRDEHEVAVVEMGISDFGEMHRLSKIVRPNICVITNIGQCHLENLKSREGILRAKTEIFDFMDEDGEVCLNGEDDMLCTVRKVGGKATHFFGLHGTKEQDVYASHIVSKGLWGSEAMLHMPEGEFPVTVTLPGRHMVINAAAAACVARLLGLSGAQIAEGLAQIQPVGGRNHLLRLEQYTVIDDCYNANPVSMEAAIDLLALADTYRVAVLGDMFELGDNSDALHAGVGAYAVKSGVDCVFCVGENSRHMYEAAVEAAMKPAVEKGDKKEQKIYHFADRETLLKFLEKQADILPRGCTVLVKASHGMHFEEVVEFLNH